jgi:hypothetical protein
MLPYPLYVKMGEVETGSYFHREPFERRQTRLLREFESPLAPL